MKVFISQPRFLPNHSYIERIASSDLFVLMDNVQYSHRDWENRNKIKTTNGAQWLTIPIKDYHQGQLINQTFIDNHIDWMRKHLKTISLNYKQAPYFDQLYQGLEKIYYHRYEKLIDLNLKLIEFILNYLSLPHKIQLLSSLNIAQETKGSDLILEICKQVGATTYLSGEMGRDYLNPNDFKKNNIQIKFIDNNKTMYQQLWGEFIPLLSIIDLLFNEGPDSLNIILHNNITKKD